MNSFCIQLKQELNELGISLEEEILEKLYSYSQLVLEKNEVLNLTSITEENEVVTKQFVDCLASLPLLNKFAVKSLVDIGSGAGFPSFPVGIALPNIQVSSVDALQKRILFQKEVIDTLSIENISSFHNRAEIVGQSQEFRESFDCVLSRAVSQLRVLLEYMSPLVKVGGYIIAYKGKNYKEELLASLNAQKQLNLELVEEFTFQLRDHQERCLLVFKKTKSTPKKYPRNNGIPNKKPL